MRLASSEHDTLASRVTSSRRQSSRRSSRICRNARRRHLATSSKPRHVTESPAMTSSWTHVTSSQGVTSPEISQESPAVTSSSSNQQGQCVVTSSEHFPGPRGRTSCRYSHHRMESPPMTSLRIPRKLTQTLREPSTSGRHHEESPPQHKRNTCEKPDYRGCIRSTSVPPPSTMPANPFSPFWNFLFKDKRTAEDDEEDHVCNTVRSPRRSWFGSSAVITNVYLSTINKWTGVWPTAASQLATRARTPTIKDGLAAENELLMSRVESQIYHPHDMAARLQVLACKCL